MLRSLAFVAVGEQEDEAGRLAPFGFAGGDELVDDDLGAIGEVAELGFPEGQGERIAERIAEFEAHDAVFAEGGVVDFESRLFRVEVLHGGEDFARLVVEVFEVALGEGATSGVLAGKADGRSFEDEGPEGEGLAHGPIGDAAIEEGAPVVDELLEFGMEVKVAGEGGDAFDDFFDGFGADGGAGAGGGHFGLFEFGDLLEFPLIAAAGGLLVGLVHPVLDLFADAFDDLAADDALAQEAFGVDGRHGGVALDLPVHQRLGVGGVVALIVAVLAIADHVDDDVFLEPLPVLEGDLDGADAGVGVVAVDVQNRGLDGPGDVGAIAGGACFVGGGGEADLIINDQMDGAAGGIALEQGEIEGFGDNALAGESGVAVYEDGEHFFAGDVVHARLFRADDAFDDRIDGLEVGRIG